MIEKARRAADDELTVAGLAVGLVLLVPGALVLAILPLMVAFNRLGYGGAGLLVLGIGIISIAFFLAYERFKPSAPPTPRRDFVVILFSALLAGLWIYLFFDAAVGGLMLGGVGAVLLLPDDWRQSFADHLPQPWRARV